MTSAISCVSVFLMVLLAFPKVAAQCPGVWVPGTGIGGFSVDDVADSILWDPDGGGPASSTLVLAINGPGVPNGRAGRVVIWNGAGWTQLGETVSDARVNLLAVYDGELISTRTRNNAQAGLILRWHSGEWTTLGPFAGNGQVNGPFEAMTIFQGDLIVGGHFTDLEGTSRIARWDGLLWQVMGTTDRPTAPVHAMAELNADLIVASVQGGIGNPTMAKLHRWNGETWQQSFGQVFSSIRALAIRDGEIIAGNGGNAFVPMDQTPARASGLARWSGSYWEAIPGFVNGSVFEIREFLGDLIVGGVAFNIPEFPGGGSQAGDTLARWNGRSWNRLGSSGPQQLVTGYPRVHTMTINGSEIIVGGEFNHVDNQVSDPWAIWQRDICEECLGDLNCSCDVELSDLARLLSHFGVEFGAAPREGDIDQDGDIDITDLSTVLANFGVVCR